MSALWDNIPHESANSAPTRCFKPAQPVPALLPAALSALWSGRISDIRTKNLRSNNPQNVVAATMVGLKSLRGAQVPNRGKSVEEILG